MPDDLTIAEVERIATLARLALSDEEKTLYAAQLGRILDYAGQVGELDARDVDPTAAVVVDPLAERTDVVRPPLAHAQALANAPDAAAGLFRVPKVLGDA
jgi:aspartyl-tRNA(Asn)/glutamyl-tRNA(Gln) amidotransferase subunit C